MQLWQAQKRSVDAREALTSQRADENEGTDSEVIAFQAAFDESARPELSELADLLEKMPREEADRLLERLTEQIAKVAIGKAVYRDRVGSICDAMRLFSNRMEAQVASELRRILDVYIRETRRTHGRPQHT